MNKITFLTLTVSGLLLMGMKAGDLAPDFSLKTQDAKTVKLSEHKGKAVLLFFYPKDETPGCTKEACTLRDTFKKFQEKGAVLYGVSTQDAKSHQQFRANHKLPFDLLVDPKGEVAQQYGVGFIPNTDLLQRKSVLIGGDGKVVKFYEVVDPALHAEEVLKDLSTISKT